MKIRIGIESADDASHGFVNSTINYLSDEALRRGHDVYVFGIGDVYLKGECPEICGKRVMLGSYGREIEEYKDMKVSALDAVIIDGNDLREPEERTRILSLAEDRVFFDPAVDAFLMNQDKLNVFLRCPEHSPFTVSASTPEEALDALNMVNDIDGYVVAKDRFGVGYGEQVHRISVEVPESAERAILSLQEKYGSVLVQEFCPEIRHGDLRITYIAGNEYPWVIREPPRDTWKTNLKKGAGVRRYFPSIKQSQMAKEVIDAFPEINFNALDAVFDSKGRMKTFEINATPGVKGLREAWGVDCVAEYLDFIERVLDGERQGNPAQD